MLQVFMTGRPPEKARQLNLVLKDLSRRKVKRFLQLLQDFSSDPARNMFTIISRFYLRSGPKQYVYNSFKILSQIRPERCLQLLQDFSSDPARNMFTITSRFYLRSGPKQYLIGYNDTIQLRTGPKYVHNYFKISTAIRPEMCSQLLQDFRTFTYGVKRTQFLNSHQVLIHPSGIEHREITYFTKM